MGGSGKKRIFGGQEGGIPVPIVLDAIERLNASICNIIDQPLHK